MKLKFTPTARSELLSAINYIQQKNHKAAQEFYQNVGQVLKRLEKFPESGRTLPEFPDLSHREVIISPYRFFYRVVDNTVWIVAVWHSAQLPQQPDEKTPL
jgi:toxin ParE1/3/4